MILSIYAAFSYMLLSLVAPGNTATLETLLTSTTATQFTWTVDLAVNTAFNAAIKDSQGVQQFTSPLTVAPAPAGATCNSTSTAAGGSPAPATTAPAGTTTGTGATTAPAAGPSGSTTGGAGASSPPAGGASNSGAKPSSTAAAPSNKPSSAASRSTVGAVGLAGLMGLVGAALF
jgi:hypothetical protein